MKKKILIVDDETSLLESLEMFFTEKGYDVACATTAAEAIAEHAIFGPDVVILDIRLPDKDGLEVLKDFHETSNKNNVIMITAFHDMDTTIRALKIVPKEISDLIRQLAKQYIIQIHIPHKPGENNKEVQSGEGLGGCR